MLQRQNNSTNTQSVHYYRQNEIFSAFFFVRQKTAEATETIN